MRRNAAARIAAIMVFGVAAGSLASLGALLFVEAVHRLNDLLWISPRSRMIAGDSVWLQLATVAVPATGGLLVGLLVRHIAEGRPLGPADVIGSVQSFAADLPRRSGLLTAAASILSLGCGASVGQYGPLTHLGATLGSMLARLRGNSHALGTVGIACGIAAVISTAFDAPISGIVFAHEVVLRHNSLQVFAPVTVASTMGYVVPNLLIDHQPLFRIESIPGTQVIETAQFALIGVLGAFVAIAFMQAIRTSEHVASKVPIPQHFKPMLAGACLGLTAIWIPEILGIGVETLRFGLIAEAYSLPELGLTLTAKILATALCLGFGFSGGVFSPSLVIGTLFGALMGTLSQLSGLSAMDNHAVFAVCGLVAVTSPVIGAPLTAILIVFELTRNYELTTAVMVSVVFSNVVAYRVFGRSFFDVQLKSRGVDLSLGRDRLVLSRQTIATYISHDFVRVDAELPLERTLARMLESDAHEAYVTDADGIYLGTIRRSDIEIGAQDEKLHCAQAHHKAQRNSPVFSRSTSIWDAMQEMRGFVGLSIAVVESEHDQSLVGIVFESSVVSAYLDTMRRIRNDEHGVG